ncbi:MAG: DUF3365 domain-containing protein [Deltaproteobacteria bacterium]|nr:DUF3365 domain-containing protein [Deltaproteobacteria bacterium]MBW2071504.1 DUF3365 domain-containing protein [Deltaproteobacteria bacterium]
MHCHGDPEDAPRSLIKIYGSDRGFGHVPDEIAGVTTVSIPMDIALANIRARAYSILWSSLLCLSMLYIMVSFFFNRLVVHSLKDLLDMFRDIPRSDKELQLLEEAKGKDEIEEITTAAQVMATHLHQSRQELEKYTETLEEMVAHRTRALESSQQRLQEKVATRNRELHTLNTIAELITRSVHLPEILPSVLKKTLDIVPAQGAAIYLLRNNPSRLELQCHENAHFVLPQLPFDSSLCPHQVEDKPTDLSSSLYEAACGHLSFFSFEEEQSGLNVPLCCRGEVLGVMCFVNLDFSEVTPEMQQLLFSVGQQIGITIESLQHTENLLQSKELLQSVFDGITDMLVLLDRDLRIKMVNRAHLERYKVTKEQVIGQQCQYPHFHGACPFLECRIEEVASSKKPLTEEV